MRTVNVIEGIFFAALEKQTPAERNAYLDEACRGDPELRICVDRMLKAQPKMGEFLQPPAPGPLPETADHPADERPGTVLGPYKLLHEIGEGGMGTVWMAEQDEPIRRRVALKVIKPGMDSRQILARFEAERQALALMDHPNIAKVLDAGATENGRPYFVMELVKGQPITEFCDKNCLPTRERLELFIAVCHAIQHAHQKGVIHRDIKPSNVLVALYDGKPVPKVIDFGVAKATAEPLTDKTLYTRHGQVVGTFEYMSPEQATLDQLDIDTRSDVYALGVLLYELLTGTTPLDKERLRQAGFAEILRLIREEEPPKPSTRLTTTPGLLATAAAYRKSDSQKLPKVVRGELDWIVMKALEKDRNRRFATANSLADDVERYLKDEPVQACPPTLGYRMRKWIRKNRVAFTTMSAVAAALMVGIALTSWQAVRATSAERATTAAMGEVEAERDKAVKLSEQLDTRLGEINAANTQIRAAHEEMRLNRYAGDMLAVSLNWEAGNVAEARQMLERQDRDLRGFEWDYWNRQMHTEVSSGQLPGLPKSRVSVGSRGRPLSGIGNWRFSGDGSRIAYFGFSEGSTKPYEHTLLIWDAATRKLLLSHQIWAEGLPADTNRISSSGDFSLSHDGKRAALALTCYVDRRGGERSEKDRWVVHAVDVDSKKPILTVGRKEDGEWSSPIVRLSRDGRKLLGHTYAVREAEVRKPGRNTVWDLDAPNKEPVIIDNGALGYFSPDGSRVLGAERTEDGSASKAWDANTGKEIPDFARGGVFSPKGTYLAWVELAGEGDSRTQTLKLYDGTTGKEISSAPLTGALVGPGPREVGSLPTLIFSPDESLVAVPHRSGTGTPRTDWRFIDTKTGQIRLMLEDPAPARSGPGFTPLRRERFFSGEGRETLFVCCDDNVIRTFNTAGGGPVHTFRGHANAIVAAVPSPDNHLLRTLESDGTLKEWNLKRPKVPAPIAAVESDRRKPGDLPTSARFGYSVSAGGGYVACVERGRGEEPYTVRVWDLAGNRTATFAALPFKTTSIPTGGRGLFISADGKRVALSRQDLGRDRGQLNPQNPPSPSDVTVWEWDPATGAEKEVFHLELPPEDANGGIGGVRHFSSDGTTIVLSRRDRVGALPDGSIRMRTTLWTMNVDTRREGPSITFDGTSLAAGNHLSPDGTRFAAIVRTPAADGSWNNQIVVWDLVRGTQVFATAPNKIVSIDSALDLSALTSEGTVFWNPDGSRVAVLNAPGAPGSITLLDAATGKLIRTLTPPTRGGLAPLNPRFAFSPDSRRIACEITQRSGATAISVLDTESGKEVLSLTPPRDPSASPFGSPGDQITGAQLIFSPDGHRLLLFRRVSGVFAEIDGKRVETTALRVHTWDATPLPKPKQP